MNNDMERSMCWQRGELRDGHYSVAETYNTESESEEAAQ